MAKPFDMIFAHLVFDEMCKKLDMFCGTKGIYIISNPRGTRIYRICECKYIDFAKQKSRLKNAGIKPAFFYYISILFANLRGNPSAWKCEVSETARQIGAV